MLSVTKRFQFDAAHLLAGHQGLCQNLHGHTYFVDVTVSRDDADVLSAGPSEGMVIDFKDLKTVLCSELFDLLDHALIYHNDEASNWTPEDDIRSTAHMCKLKTFQMQHRPTAENMCLEFVKRIRPLLSKVDPNLRLVRIRVYETPTSYAEVEV